MRWLGGVFVIAWIWFSYQPLRIEFESLRTIASLWRVDAVTKRRQIDGPLYDFVQRATEIIPPHQKELVYLFTPDREYTYYKSNYYLYPRSLMLIDPARLGAQDISPGAYLIVYLPPRLSMRDLAEVKRDWEMVRQELPPIGEIHRTANAGIYRVLSGR
jgi:hypothetical protein